MEQPIGSQAGEWARLLPRLDPAIAHDPDRLVVAQRLHRLEVDGVRLAPVVKEALAQGHLPADHAASALWYRVTGLLRRGRAWPPPERRWEAVKPRQVPRPESERMPPPMDRGRHGPHIGF